MITLMLMMIMMGDGKYDDTDNANFDDDGEW